MSDHFNAHDSSKKRFYEFCVHGKENLRHFLFERFCDFRTSGKTPSNINTESGQMYWLAI